MGEAIGQVLAPAVGVALSPVPIIAVILMLVTPGTDPFVGDSGGRRLRTSTRRWDA